jgi:hypothetical protein
MNSVENSLISQKYFVNIFGQKLKNESNRDVLTWLQSKEPPWHCMVLSLIATHRAIGKHTSRMTEQQ